MSGRILDGSATSSSPGLETLRPLVAHRGLRRWLPPRNPVPRRALRAMRLAHGGVGRRDPRCSDRGYPRWRHSSLTSEEQPITRSSRAAWRSSPCALAIRRRVRDVPAASSRDRSRGRNPSARKRLLDGFLVPDYVREKQSGPSTQPVTASHPLPWNQIPRRLWIESPTSKSCWW